ncbi:hypothetical protein GCG21_08285 [Pseudactinotalea sp. HY160]|uniref:GyrI-like domain-containing protein n=1 Tax=Pseudactinotalea sp. HY160 TaxID=2654490 RepID=UPI00128B7832|nr:GyrI-like domain-containing protein [Pseudactinotalea sp. HY160]MPV50003.1 hypothetical protein [Pseudactinotalea sp. HY160]
MTAAKVDVKKDLDSYRARSGRFRLLDVPPRRYLAVDGAGDPNTSPTFTAAIETLYPVAYGLKFASRDAGRDYVVPPLEGLWWADDIAAFTSARDKSRWHWRLLLLVPEWLGPDDVDAATAAAAAKGAGPRLADLHLEDLHEGRCVQTLHVGPFDDEAGVLRRLHCEFLRAHDLRPTGVHHEIYLSDVRRAAPDRRRTILRQPVE